MTKEDVVNKVGLKYFYIFIGCGNTDRYYIDETYRVIVTKDPVTKEDVVKNITNAACFAVKHLIKKVRLGYSGHNSRGEASILTLKPHGNFVDCEDFEIELEEILDIF